MLVSDWTLVRLNLSCKFLSLIPQLQLLAECLQLFHESPFAFPIKAPPHVCPLVLFDVHVASTRGILNVSRGLLFAW